MPTSSSDPSDSGSILPVADARGVLGETLARESGWTDACERAAMDLARSLLAGGIDKRSISSELRKVGISRSGARQILRAAARAEPSAPPGNAEDTAGRQSGGAGPELTEGEIGAGAADERRAGQSDEDLLICPHCARPIGRFDHFCPGCRGPVTAHASMDPLGLVYSAGRAYRNATSGHPRSIVLLGMWLIFGPQIPLLLYYLYLTLSDVIAPARGYLFEGASTAFHIGDDMIPIYDGLTVTILKLVLAGGLLTLYLAILWKVTSRHIRVRGEANG